MSKNLIISLVLISSISSFYSIQLNSTIKLSNNQTINETRLHLSNSSFNLTLSSASNDFKHSSFSASVNRTFNDKNRTASNQHTNSNNSSSTIDASLINNQSLINKRILLNANQNKTDLHNSTAPLLDNKLETLSSNSTNQTLKRFNDISRFSSNLTHTDQTVNKLNDTNQIALNSNDTNQTAPSLNKATFNSPNQHSNGTSSVVHLLSNEDIKEYQIKRKEEDEMKKVHLKELKTKNKEKSIELLPIRKSKQQDIETNDLNHLQEIDVIDDVKIVKETHKPQLIVVSLDAFRYDYIKLFKNNVGNFVRMAKLGVSAP